jgi:hypothetical protein
MVYKIYDTRTGAMVLVSDGPGGDQSELWVSAQEREQLTTVLEAMFPHIAIHNSNPGLTVDLADITLPHGTLALIARLQRLEDTP